jgi:drug/metabolite transporter (DMT)-like permease
MASFYILAAIFIWSSLGIFVRAAGTPLTDIIFFSSLTALIVQCIIVLLTDGIKDIPPPRKIPSLLLLGPVLLMNHMLFFYAFTHTTIANAVLTHYTAPVFVAVLAPFLLKEKTDKFVIIAIIISSVGLGFLLKGFSISAHHLSGIFAGTLSGLTYAFIIIIGRFLAKIYSPLIITVFQNLMVVLLLLPFIREVPVDSLGYLAVMGILHSTAAPLLYIRGLKEVSANRASILGYLEPVSAVLLAFLFFKEVPGVRSILGGALIILSGYMILTRGITETVFHRK